MFTGLIRGIGHLRTRGDKLLVVCDAHQPWVAALALGDSVAVDGVCLTVETLVPEGFMVTTSPETMARTTLAERVETQAPVNLEPALRVGDRLGGHFVTGHIDGTGTVEAVTPVADAWEIQFQVPGAIARYIVSKGSIAVNGISLTVANCNLEGTWFSVAVIPHSFAETNLQQLRPGTTVNLENDVLGKYVAKFLTVPDMSEKRQLNSGIHDVQIPITPEFLTEHGFG